MVCKHRDDIPAFLNEEGLTGYGAEIGVFRGEYSEVLLKNWGGQKLYLIDVWKHLEGTVDISNHSDEGHEENLKETVVRIAPYKDRAEIIRGFSKDASIKFQDEYFDFVYLDAGHTYKDVVSDIKHWYPKIKINGYLMGHDYLDCTMVESNRKLLFTIFEVKSAVDGFAFLNSTKVTTVPDKFFPSWYIKKLE